MSAKIIVSGRIEAVNPYLDPVTKSPTGLYAVQLLKRNARNAVELLNVKLYEGADLARYTEGTEVELVVDVSTYKDAVHYRATCDLLNIKTDLRNVERAAAGQP